MTDLSMFNAQENVTIGFKKEDAPINSERFRKKKEIKLEQVSIKLHPDIIKAVATLASNQRKMPAEIMRDLILKGLNAEGIKL